jgi:acylphosphatase
VLFCYPSRTAWEDSISIELIMARQRFERPGGREFLKMRTIHLSISGRVQGVGFRDALRREAERLGIVGWVRNRAVGDVEAVVQGNDAALDALLAWARRGPAAARVERVAQGAPAPEHARDYACFECWPSV